MNPGCVRLHAARSAPAVQGEHGQRGGRGAAAAPPQQRVLHAVDEGVLGTVAPPAGRAGRRARATRGRDRPPPAAARARRGGCGRSTAARCRARRCPSAPPSSRARSFIADPTPCFSCGSASVTRGVSPASSPVPCRTRAGPARPAAPSRSWTRPAWTATPSAAGRDDQTERAGASGRRRGGEPGAITRARRHDAEGHRDQAERRDERAVVAARAAGTAAAGR